MTATRFDHIAKEAGLITKLPGRSKIMSSKITFEYEGNLAGLIEFMEARFKEPNEFTFKIHGDQKFEADETPKDRLIKAVLFRLNKPSSYAPALNGNLHVLLTAIKGNLKIQAIKDLRNITDCGLKEAKDAVENELTAYINAGGA